MGLDITFFTIYGVHINSYDNKLSDLYFEVEEIAAKGDNPHILFDGMDGKYMVFGHVLFQGSCDGDGDSFVFMPKQDLLDQIREWYTENFKKIYPDYAHYIAREWNLITFAHYS